MIKEFTINLKLKPTNDGRYVSVSIDKKFRNEYINLETKHFLISSSTPALL